MSRIYRYQQYTSPVPEAVVDESTPWHYTNVRNVPRLRGVNRDNTADVRVSGFEAINIDQWQSLDWRQYKLRLSNRDNTAHLVEILGVPSTTIDEWAVYDPVVYRLRKPQQDHTADVRISGFEAIDISQWQSLDWRQYKLRQANRDYLSQLIEFTELQATSVDQWKVYDPTVYRLRLPNRDNTSDTRISGFEATFINQWQSLDWRQYKLRKPQRDNTSQLIELIFIPATSIDEWASYEPVVYRLREPNRQYTVDPITFVFSAPPTEFLYIFEAVILPSANGTVQLRIEPVSGATTITVRRGSLGFMREAEA